jgi:hypothetical protein
MFNSQIQAASECVAIALTFRIGWHFALGKSTLKCPLLCAPAPQI